MKPSSGARSRTSHEQATCRGRASRAGRAAAADAQGAAFSLSRTRAPLDNRAALTGLLFVLKTGLPWNDLRREMGWWQQGGVLGAPARVARVGRVERLAHGAPKRTAP